MTANPIQTQVPDQKTPQPRAGSSRGKSTTVRLVDAKQLQNYQDVWAELSSTAVVRNPFYEPWMMLPALERLVDKEVLYFLLVFGPVGKHGPQPLWGLFPLEIQPKCLHLPIRTLAFWHHRYSSLATPLIAADHAWDVLESFWKWFQSNPFRCRILDTNYLLAEGRFHAVWADFAIGRCSIMLNEFPRALLEPSGTAESYISNAVSKKHYGHFLRQERQLAALGTLKYHLVTSVSDVDAWVDEFLRLEASGWKGRDGGAFAKQPENAAFLREITRDGFLRNCLVLSSLHLDGKAIAMIHNLRAGEGAFTFKIAYDEEYGKYSPGLLLQLEYLRRLFHDPLIKWIDSGASPRHPLFCRIWSERRLIGRTLFSDGSRLGDFVISALPLLRWIKNQVRPDSGANYLRISTKESKSGKGDL
jgi:hypothetical protein